MQISPSILSCDFTMFKSEITNISNAGADYIHVDVMDGNFVPNLTFGPPIIKKLRPLSKLPFDVHLMIERPELSVDQYINAGADIICFHFEACTHPHRLLNYIKEKNIKAGIAINPTTSIETISDIIEYCDQIIIMGVNPGFSGQKFIESSIRKVSNLKKFIIEHNLQTKIEFDGGVSDKNSMDLFNAGADILVSGSYIFNVDASEYSHQIKKLKNM